MTTYADLPGDELGTLKAELEAQYAEIKARGLALNMARGKPGADQLDLSMPMLATVTTAEDCRAEDGTDCRNYGVLDGLPEAKRFMACMVEEDPANIVVGGNSSLSLMYEAVARCLDFGTLGSKPWSQYHGIKWLCPTPGYDRHFGITEAFGIEMIPVPMTADGPDMDEVERLVAGDASVKGIWCVPKYSNPGGVTYSDDVVRRLAAMECAADDFRIFWDNAYCVHHLYDDAADQDQLLDIGAACREAGNEHRYFKFASTSKVTHPGSGISAIAASPDNIAEIKKRMGVGTIGYDKLNQLRHVKFLKDADGLAAHMAKHAAILRPKFELVVSKLDEGLAEVGGCSWSSPRGGYFVSFDAPEGTAKRIVGLAKEAGVTMTGAGATYPYKQDPRDSNIRIAPTLPPLAELDAAMDVFVCCVKLAYAEKRGGLGAQGARPRGAPPPHRPPPAPRPRGGVASHPPPPTHLEARRRWGGGTQGAWRSFTAAAQTRRAFSEARANSAPQGRRVCLHYRRHLEPPEPPTPRTHRERLALWADLLHMQSKSPLKDRSSRRISGTSCPVLPLPV